MMTTAPPSTRPGPSLASLAWGAPARGPPVGQATPRRRERRCRSPEASDGGHDIALTDKGLAKQREDLRARLARRKRACELALVQAKATSGDFLSAALSNASALSWARAAWTPAATHHAVLGFCSVDASGKRRRVPGGGCRQWISGGCGQWWQGFLCKNKTLSHPEHT